MTPPEPGDDRSADDDTHGDNTNVANTNMGNEGADNTDADSTAEPDAVPGESIRRPGDEPDRQPSHRRWPGSKRQRLIAAATAVLLTVCAYDSWALFSHHRRQVASDAALAAAESFALALTSIDSENIDEDFAAVLDASTGEFKDLYTRSSAQLRQLMVESKAGAHGTVIDAAVESASPKKATVLLFIDQTVHNKKAPDPQLDRSRVVVTMEKKGRPLAGQSGRRQLTVER